jgi:transposase
MAAIVHQTDKRSGITYAYESISYWDKEKKQSRAKRTLIGRVDKESGEIVPTDGRGRRKKKKVDTISYSKRSFYGATYLLDKIGEKLGIVNDLKQCYPQHYQQILSIAYYLILESNSPLYRFEKWSMLHRHPFGQNISSQRSSELFAMIDEKSKNSFFSLQAKRREKEEYWAYDTTSISSYSEQLRQVQYGHNKENDPLAQLNLALVFGEKSNLPFYYRKLSGNIPDSKTLNHLLVDLEHLGFNRAKLVMDRGFYSKSNINALYKAHRKFIISTKSSLNFVKRALEPIYDTFRSFESYSEEYELYTHTVQSSWEYEQERPYKGDIIKAKRRIYIHYYYNLDRACEDEKAFDSKLIKLRNELISGERISANENLYNKYFTIKETPKRGIQVQVKEEAVKEAKRYYGFFVLLSNETMDALSVLEIYRNKDVVEKAFGNLKERLSMRRMLVSSEQSLDGKLFVEFIALIYLSHIKKQMQIKGMFKQYTLQGMLDKLDVIECFEESGHKLRIGEILEKQKSIFLDIGVEVPR